MYPVLFQIGPFTIYSLGVLWAVAAVCAGYVVRLELKRYRLDPELASSMVFAAAIGGLVGARLLLILEEWSDFLRSPWEFIFSGAGFSWYGGLIGGTLAVSWWVRRQRIPWLKAADIAAPALALGYGVDESAASSRAMQPGVRLQTCRGEWRFPMRSPAGSIL